MEKHSAPRSDTAARLLIPIDATDESRWGLRHAIRRAEQGAPVEVCLLCVAEPVRNWEVLRFYTEEEVRRHFQERSAIFLEEAAQALRAAGIPCQALFREADDTARAVVDLAEQLECSEIVVPRTLCLGLFPCGLAHRLVRRHGAIPVTQTREDGSIAS